MSDFLVLAKKEIKNLMRDRKLIFGLIIVPLIVYPALGKMMQFGFESATKETHVAIVNFDDGKYGELLIRALNVTPNVTVTVISAGSVDDALRKALQENQNVLVVIPHNFSESIESDEAATVQIYGVFKEIGSGMRESVSEGRINAVINVLSEEIAKLKVQELGAKNPDAVLHPIRAESKSYLLGRIVDVPPTVVSQVLASQSYGLPLIVFLMVMITSQMSAGAVASEKENKTLETLLTLPVRRTTIVASKITGTAVMGVIAALAYMIGLKQYMAGFGTQTGVSLSELGLSITPTGMALFGVVVFLTIAFSLSLAMLLAVFAEDVQSANTVVSSVILPLAFPSFVLMFVDISQLPALWKYLLFASPFTHPVVDYRYLIAKDYTALGASIAYLAIVAGATLYVTARVFASEKILTARLGWGRRKGRE
ncbi:ABC transporter permease [Thermococcus nautili]|uniref:ABC-type Na+ efflux pump, permease component n=1 Tax=Thermococcus nautili TaxID=195522 RepID=W8P3D2_9EURY|nr:ABC transporter permease [Thermococcus nautili]AHL23271.1 ABC-type Na+ efflux pump, permease component [Thermococcus nautili]